MMLHRLLLAATLLQSNVGVAAVNDTDSPANATQDDAMSTIVGDLLTSPPVHECTADNPVILEARHHEDYGVYLPTPQRVDGKDDWILKMNTRAYYYEGEVAIPGPTIRMTPGQTCKVILKNEMHGNRTYQMSSALPRMDVPDNEELWFSTEYNEDGSISFPPKYVNSLKCPYHRNQPHCLDDTNLHTHGLHVSGENDEDNIAVTLSPGEEFEYSFRLPSDHLMGTHWWHPHVHGSTWAQVGGGMAGTIDVLPPQNKSVFDLPPELKELYDDAEFLLISHIDFHGLDPVETGVCNMGGLNAMLENTFNGGRNTLNPNIRYSEDHSSFWYVDDRQDPLGYGRDFVPSQRSLHRPITTVNNQYQPYVELAPEKTKLLRIVHASGMRTGEMKIMNDEDGHCEWATIARDGIFQDTPYGRWKDVVMMPGSRVDLAVRCDASADGMVFNVGLYRNPQYDRVLSPWNRLAQEIVFQLKVGGGEEELLNERQIAEDAETDDAPLIPEDASLVDQFPPYLKSLMSQTIEDMGMTPFNLVFQIKEPPNPGVWINKHVFEGFGIDPGAAKLCVDTNYEVLLQGELSETLDALRATNSVRDEDLISTGYRCMHPYHQHINPFQIYSIPAEWSDGNTDGVIVRPGEWRDVAPVNVMDTLRIRFNTADFDGKYVFHCHILQHEDVGMMSYYDVASPKSVVTREKLPPIQNEVATGEVCMSCSGVLCQRPPPWPQAEHGEGDDVHGCDDAENVEGSTPPDEQSAPVVSEGKDPSAATAATSIVAAGSAALALAFIMM